MRSDIASCASVGMYDALRATSAVLAHAFIYQFQARIAVAFHYYPPLPTLRDARDLK